MDRDGDASGHAGVLNNHIGKIGKYRHSFIIESRKEFRRNFVLLFILSHCHHRACGRTKICRFWEILQCVFRDTGEMFMMINPRVIPAHHSLVGVWSSNTGQSHEQGLQVVFSVPLQPVVQEPVSLVLPAAVEDTGR